MRSATARAIMGTAAMAVLNGCATFGSNVKGSFSCVAPDGICAPSSSIDDRALAMIAGESGAGDMSPAGPYMESRPRSQAARTAAAGQRLPIGQPDPRRTQERVLRIVFQPYIDGQGRLHEASAIHAVVQTGEWQQQALMSASVIPDRNARAIVPAPESLAEVVDRADPAIADVAAIDPDLPDPAAIAAARARAADPVGAIKSEVAARLAPKTGRTPAPQAPAVQSRTTARSVEGAPATPSAASGKDPGPRPNAATVVATPQPKITAGQEAAASVKASPAYRAGATRAEEGGRAAAATAALPDAKSAVEPTVRAAGFPAAVPEDN
ncbi:type IV conjugative transfer system protein TraV (plasmid) [Sphingomonas psychrotolerans]|uniref:Type IV conjugative transfer system protein TraV n=2 Tax=Sphingomonas psychrotolerans TaxID=1327635 RepID=A0A2K8MMA5_9SPHN|nr:type IV conjugative transfer system protein TraV [Sphingomonas psychrotolerans]